MHGRTIRALRTLRAQQPNQIVSQPNKQRFGVLDHHVDQINEDKRMYQGQADRGRMGVSQGMLEMEILFQIKISCLIINSCSNFNSYRFRTLMRGHYSLQTSVSIRSQKKKSKRSMGHENILKISETLGRVERLTIKNFENFSNSARLTIISIFLLASDATTCTSGSAK